jgi:hypothetical protein
VRKGINGEMRRRKSNFVYLCTFGIDFMMNRNRKKCVKMQKNMLFRRQYSKAPKT